MLGSYDELMVAEKFVSTTCRIPAQQVMPECQGPRRNMSLSAGPPLLLSVTRLFFTPLSCTRCAHAGRLGFPQLTQGAMFTGQACSLARHSKISALLQNKDSRNATHAKCKALSNALFWYTTLVFLSGLS